jgi:hypothetical protein
MYNLKVKKLNMTTFTITAVFLHVANVNHTQQVHASKRQHFGKSYSTLD